MSKYLLTLVFAFHHIFVFSQRFIWANNSVITNTISEGLYVAVDEKGSVYVTGGYSSVMKLGNQTFTAMGREDVFLAKYEEDYTAEELIRIYPEWFQNVS